MEIKCSQKSRKFFFAAIAFLFFITINSFAFASHETDEINQVIKQKKARWLAGETSVSKLSKEERKKLLGSFLPDITEAAPSNAAESYTASEIVSVPVAFDWRNYNGGNFVTPVRNQSNCGSCWAFATTAALEAQVLISDNTPGINVDLSEQTLVCCSGAGSCSGGYIGTASDYIRDAGLPAESCCPYAATNNSCTNTCADYYTITGWHWVTSTTPTIDAIKNHLCTYGPLVTTMDVYSDFYSYRLGVYSYVTGTYQGGHAVLIVGYDDAGQYFIVKNSWGAGWGEAGYFRIAYSELASVTDFGDYSIAYEGNGIQPPPPPPACTYTISPASKTFKSTAATGSVSVATQSGCAWTATSNAAWITIKSGMSGSGNGTVVYAISANTTTSLRTGTVTIAGLTFTVKQQGVRIKR